MKLTKASVMLVVIVVVVFVGAVVALPVMLLWDWLMPSLFGLNEITYFQAWGLYILCAILFQSRVVEK